MKAILKALLPWLIFGAALASSIFLVDFIYYYLMS